MDNDGLTWPRIKDTAKFIYPDLTGFRLLQTSGRGIEIFEGHYIAGRRIPSFHWACLLVFGEGNLTAAGELDHPHDLAIVPVWLAGHQSVLPLAEHVLGSRLRSSVYPRIVGKTGGERDVH